MKYNWQDGFNLLSLPNISSLSSGAYTLKLVAKDDREIFKNSEPSESVAWEKPDLFRAEAEVVNAEVTMEDYVGVEYPMGQNEYSVLYHQSPTNFVYIPVQESSSAILYVACGLSGTASATINGSALVLERHEEETYAWYESGEFVPATEDLVHIDITYGESVEEPEEVMS